MSLDLVVLLVPMVAVDHMRPHAVDNVGFASAIGMLRALVMIFMHANCCQFPNWALRRLYSWASCWLLCAAYTSVMSSNHQKDVIPPRM